MPRGRETGKTLVNKLRVTTMKVRNSDGGQVLWDQFLVQVAVEGCCHGDLDAIYKHIQELESKNGYKVDLLLICGDFQAVRNRQDLQCMAVPNKYKEMKDFHK